MYHNHKSDVNANSKPDRLILICMSVVCVLCEKKKKVMYCKRAKVSLASQYGHPGDKMRCECEEGMRRG